MRFTSILIGIATAALALASPVIGDSDVSTTTTQNLSARNICLSVFGFRLGSCYGSWGRGRYNQYQYQCKQLGWSPAQRVDPQGGLLFKWQTTWVIETDWFYAGRYWLPEDPNIWGYEGPAPWTPRGLSYQLAFDKYKSACKFKGFKPHYYWDDYRSGYYYLYEGSFHFEADFVYTSNTLYWVPQPYYW